MTPFHDNSTAPPSTVTGEQRPLLQVSSIVVANNDTNPTSIPIAVGSSTAPRSTTKWWSLLAAATTLVLLVCVARRHGAHRVRSNPGRTPSGSRSSEMSAVHDASLVRVNPFGTCLNGTVCGPGMSCDYSHFCDDNAPEGGGCGYDGDGLECVAGCFCNYSTDYFFWMCTLLPTAAPTEAPTDVCVCAPDMSCDYSHVCRDDATEGEACGRDGNGIKCAAGYECNPDGDFSMCTLVGKCAANYGSTELCCEQAGWEYSPDPVPPQYQCPHSEPTCVNKYHDIWGTCE